MNRINRERLRLDKKTQNGKTGRTSSPCKIWLLRIAKARVGSSNLLSRSNFSSTYELLCFLVFHSATTVPTPFIALHNSPYPLDSMGFWNNLSFYCPPSLLIPFKHPSWPIPNKARVMGSTYIPTQIFQRLIQSSWGLEPRRAREGA